MTASPPNPRPPTPGPRPLTPAYRLTITEKKRILLNNLYGVDIDPQAVEVTKLSLLLKVLEGESQQTLDNQLRLFHERALPDLGGNIKCGNSLIGPDFYDNQQLGLLDDEERYRINVFDWNEEFPQVFPNRARKEAARTSGADEDQPLPHGRGSVRDGFDCVIGNPPWGQKEIDKTVRVAQYLRNSYSSASGIFDLFRPFVEKGITLTRNGGRFGMVLPDIVLLKDYQETRRLLLDKIAMDRIDWWGMAFSQAVIDAATITGSRTTARPDHVITATVRERERTFLHHIAQADFARNERLTFNLFLTQDKREVLNRLSDCPRLGDYFEIHEGVHSGNIRDELFVPRKLDRSCRELLFGRDEIVPYVLSWHGKFIRLSALPQQRLRSRYANAGQANWYDREKLLVRRTGDFVLAAVDPEKHYASNNFFIVFPVRPFDLDLYGLCAVLNSHFMTWYFRMIEPRVGRVFAELKIKHLRTFPLPTGDAASKACRQLNELGQARWDAGRRLASAQTPHQKETFARECKAIDKKIETLVLSSYELDLHHCGLIEKEISDAQKEQDVA